MFRENPEEYIELWVYGGAVAKHIFWQDRAQVASAIEDFLAGKIDSEELCSRIYGFRNMVNDKFYKFTSQLISEPEKFQDFKIDVRSEKIDGLLTRLFIECENCANYYQNDEFYAFIKNEFLNLQAILKEE